MEGEATLGELFENAEQYSKTSAELFKLKAISKTADVASSLLSKFIVIFFIGMSMLIASIGISIWIGEILGGSYYGFLIVAGFYLVIGLFLHLVRYKWIKMPVSNRIIIQALK